jgi:hypothetical protein
MLLDGKEEYCIIPNKKDWKFSNKDFTAEGFVYKNKKGKVIITISFPKNKKKLISTLVAETKYIHMKVVRPKRHKKSKFELWHDFNCNCYDCRNRVSFKAKD